MNGTDKVQPGQLTKGQLTKGHGTANDFVLLFDPDGTVGLSEERVRELANRHTGIGGDGVIRVIRSAALAEPAGVAAADAGAQWFMDYRNADGSVAEMCGNGVRVFAHYVLSHGLVDSLAGSHFTTLADGQTLRVGTRAGVKDVTVIPDPYGGAEPWYRVNMGRWRLPATGEAFDATVATSGVDVDRPGLGVDVGNPHTVVALAHLEELAAADLHAAPRVTPVPPNGTNVEFIVIEPDGDSDPTTGSLRMRVHERGVGETQACGTGACAAAVAAYTWAGGDSGVGSAGAAAGSAVPVTWTVHQPGGAVRVEIVGDAVTLAGPAVLVADLTLLT